VCAAAIINRGLPVAGPIRMFGERYRVAAGRNSNNAKATLSMKKQILYLALMSMPKTLPLPSLRMILPQP